MKRSHLIIVFPLALQCAVAQAQNQPAKPAKPATAPKPASQANAAKAETPREGELRLDGKITAVLGPGAWQIEAYSFTSPRGVTKDFDEIKTKSVKVGPGGSIHPRGEDEPVAAADVKLGSRVAVIGKNDADGSVIAREVVLLEGYGQLRTLGHVSVNGITSVLIGKSREAFETGDVGKAISLSNQALQAAEAAGDRPGQAFSNSELGLIFIRTQQYDRARESYEKAVSIWKSVGNSESQAIALNGLAGAYLGLEQADKALPYAQDAAGLAKSSPLLRESTLHRLSSIYEALGKKEEAVGVLEELAPLADGVGDHDVAVESLLEIAQLTLKSAPDRARKALNDVDTALPKLKDAKSKAALGGSAAALWRLLGDKDGALSRLETAAKALEGAGDAVGAGKIRALAEKWKAGQDVTPPAADVPPPPADNPPPPPPGGETPPITPGDATGDGGGDTPDN